MSLRHAVGIGLLCLLSAGARADIPTVSDLACPGFTLVSVSLDDKKADYTLSATCQYRNQYHDKDLGVDESDTYTGKLTIHATYDRKSKDAREESTWSANSAVTNVDRVDGKWQNVPPVSASPTNLRGTYGGLYKGTAVITGKCKHDPFSNQSGANAHCSNRKWTANPDGDYYTLFSQSDGSIYNLTFNGKKPLPFFLADRAVNDKKAQEMDTAVDETKISAPTVVSPKDQQHFYTQDVLLRALVPTTYKNDKQTCCLIELQKAGADGTSWNPPLPIVGKANVDTQGWTVTFQDFQQIGFGKYRVRMAPNKYNPQDAQPWSDYVVFYVWPKEVIEVPVVSEPKEGQTYNTVLPIDITVPQVAKKAGVQCCEIGFQVQHNGNWVDLKNITEPRLTDNAVQYDPYSIYAGGGAMRLRVRFHKSVGDALNWSSWRSFNVPEKTLESKPGSENLSGNKVSATAPSAQQMIATTTTTTAAKRATTTTTTTTTLGRVLPGLQKKL